MKSTASQLLRLLALFCLVGVPSGARAFYDSNLGRWLNRDPITELSDKNLHRFVANRPSTTIDSYGLNWVPSEELLKWDTNGDGVLNDDDYIQRILAQGNPGLQPSLLGDLILGGGARACVPRPAFVTVCRWGRPGLRPDDWVMNGGKNWGNYIFPENINQLRGLAATFQQHLRLEKNFSFIGALSAIQGVFSGLLSTQLVRGSGALDCIMRAFFSFAMIGFSLLVIMGNAWIAIRWYYAKVTSTMIPLVGGLTGLAGILLLPDPRWNTLCWLPLVLDLGCLPLFISVGIDAIKKRCRKGTGTQTTQEGDRNE